MIKELLASGPMDADQVRKAVVREVGCSPKTVTNAANKLRIEKTSVRRDDGTVDHWTWSLPTPLTFNVKKNDV